MSYAIPLPARPRLDFYRKLAKELLHASADASAEGAVRAWAIRWLEASDWFRSANQPNDWERRPVDMHAEWVESRWRESRKKKGDAAPLLADAQFFLAREHGFLSGPKFAEQVRGLESAHSPAADFEAAVDAIVAGDEQVLAALLRKDPALAKARSLREHHSTLLHYCSANGVEDYRQSSPENIVAIARLLLDAGADVNAESDAYGGRSTTLGLVATSEPPERAGVQIALFELLLDRGAAIDVGKISAVVACLRNGRARAAEFLAAKGARLDLEGAAGLGELDAVKGFFAEDGGLRDGATEKQLGDGLGWACEFGRLAVVEFLLSHGAWADVALNAEKTTPLHWAALGGHPEIVRTLIASGADVNAREKSFDGTPVGWAVYGYGHHDGTPEEERFYEVVDILVAAGAEIGSLIHADRRMMAALLGELSR